MDNYLKFKELINNSNHIVFFGGAGVSTESGIPDFRSETGLYNLKSKYNKSYEEMLSHHYYENNTSTFYKFYKEFMINKNASPNDAHKYLANLEKKKDLWIITQNIDGLHQLAGSKNVIELHGSIHRNFCEKCAKLYNLEEFLSLGDIPICPKCGGIVKPDVVLYEEPLNELTITKAIIKIMEADLLIIAGTSLKVYPANSFINYFKGDNIIVISKEKLDITQNVTLNINEPIASFFKKVSSL